MDNLKEGDLGVLLALSLAHELDAQGVLPIPLFAARVRSNAMEMGGEAGGPAASKMLELAAKMSLAAKQREQGNGGG